MLAFIIISLSILAIGLVSLGIYAEIQGQTLPQILSPYAFALRQAFKNHPHPGQATLESLVYLVLLLPLLEHMLRPNDGIMAFWVWAVTIIPHEAGHVLCIPFGRFATVAGGSVWQVLIFFLVGLWDLYVHHRLVAFLGAGIIAGHSFINMAVYIRDAQERELDLLFGLGEDAHDWGNLLTWTGLLRYDDAIAALAVTVGVLLVVCMLAIGILAAWIVPRGNPPRFEGQPLRHLWRAWQAHIPREGEIL